MTGYNKKYFSFLLLTSMISISCTTIVTIRTENPPLVYMQDMKTITVIPLEWKDNGIYGYLARDLTRELTRGVRRSKIYTFINPAILKNIDRQDYWEYVDVYLDCEVTNVTIEDKIDRIPVKDSDETKTRRSIIRTVTVYITYKYISAIDGKVLASFNKRFQANDKLYHSRSTIINILSRIDASNRIAINAIRDIPLRMYNELNPHTTKERKNILKSTSGDPVFKEAERLVRRKRYDDAVNLYRRLYEETGSVVACYNMAILLEAKNQFMEALELLEKVDEELASMEQETPSFITEEIEKLRLIGIWNDDDRK
jgi:tetratricopeptide (TPR) repeat protein